MPPSAPPPGSGPPRPPVPSVDDAPGLQLLVIVLSVVAGSADVISFLGLGGLFVAHITGNLVILAAHLAAGTPGNVGLLLSVPVFVLALGLTRVLAAGLDAAGLATLRPLLLLQLLLLAGFLVLAVAAGPHPDPNAAIALGAGMLGVAAMAVQNGLVPLSLRGALPTAVMTSNLTRFTMDVGQVLLGHDRAEVTQARRRGPHLAGDRRLCRRRRWWRGMLCGRRTRLIGGAGRLGPARACAQPGTRARPRPTSRQARLSARAVQGWQWPVAA
jgi:uncharacterized membrane protein YoaK (UPF0700 family)